MKKRLLTMILMGGFILVTANAQAGGQDLFVEKCGSCHKKGGQAASVNPADKAGRVWKKYFKRGRHPVDMGVDDTSLETIIQYLADHAADSDQPASAVIPK